jgi:hypothetical protein
MLSPLMTSLSDAAKPTAGGHGLPCMSVSGVVGGCRLAHRCTGLVDFLRVHQALAVLFAQVAVLLGDRQRWMER